MVTIRGSLRRTDWLRELYGLLLTGVVLSALLGVLSVTAIVTGEPIGTSAASGAVLVPDALVATGSGVTAGVGIDLRIEDPTGAQLALSALAAAPTYVLTTALLVLLARLVGAAHRADPFTSDTARRLRTLGWLLIIGGPSASALEFAAQFFLSGTATTEGARADLDLGTPALWFVAGVGLLAASEVIRRGQALRAELDTVV